MPYVEGSYINCIYLTQLECLHSEIRPNRPMITHTSDSHQIPSENKTKSKLQILEYCQKLKFCKKVLHVTHLLKLLDMMYKYEMDPTRVVYL